MSVNPVMQLRNVAEILKPVPTNTQTHSMEIFRIKLHW